MTRSSVYSVLFVIADLAALIVQTTGLPTTTLTTNDPSCFFSVYRDNSTSLEYDLCPLLRRDQYQVSRIVETPPSRTKVSFRIGFHTMSAKVLIRWFVDPL